MFCFLFLRWPSRNEMHNNSCTKTTPKKTLEDSRLEHGALVTSLSQQNLRAMPLVPPPAASPSSPPHQHIPTHWHCNCQGWFPQPGSRSESQPAGRPASQPTSQSATYPPPTLRFSHSCGMINWDFHRDPGPVGWKWGGWRGVVSGSLMLIGKTRDD